MAQICQLLVVLCLATTAFAQMYRSQALVGVQAPILKVTATDKTTAPQITAFSCATLSIDNTGTVPTSRQSQCSVTVTDTNLGFVSISYSFVGPLGAGYGKFARAATASCTYITLTTSWLCDPVQIPRFAAVGAWTMVVLDATDYNGNVDHAVSRFPVTITVTGTADSTPPTLSVFRFTPADLTVALNAGQYSHAGAQAWVNCTDDGVGCSQVILFAQPPSGSSNMRMKVGNMNPTLGLTQTGMVEFTTGSPPTTTFFAGPVAYATGTWTFYRLIAVDHTGNFRVYEGSAIPALAGISITVTQPANPGTKLYNMVSYAHWPTSITVSGVIQATVSFQVVVDGDLSQAINERITVYLQHATKPTFNLQQRLLRVAGLVGGNTVYNTSATYSDYQVQLGDYNVVAVILIDQFGSKNVYGNCPFVTPNPYSSASTDTDCTDTRIEVFLGSAAAMQVSFLVFLVALVAPFLF